MSQSSASQTWEVQTPEGPARLLAEVPERPWLLLALGHGASGGPAARDLTTLARRLPPEGVAVVRVEQPWRLAGRRVASPPPRLDRAWLSAIPQLQHLVADGVAAPCPDLPLVVGGRSAGARVACRTATALGATGCLALAFPLHPPGRPDKSRFPELAGSGVATLVVQGTRDPFGGPDEFGSGSHVMFAITGANHSLATTAPTPQAAVDEALTRATLAWLRSVAGQPVETDREAQTGNVRSPDGVGSD